MTVRQTKIALIGAGIGGLAAAVRLAHQGFQVEVYEKGDKPGGRANQLDLNGFKFDTGPTLLLMPEVLEETFRAVGRELKDYLSLSRCDPNYRIHFRDGSDVTFSTDLVQMQRELERVEPGSFNRYLSFLALGEKQYKTSVAHFVGRNFDSPLQMMTPRNLKRVLEIKALNNMYKQVGKSFRDDRLRAALTFQTMYLGISPYESPAVYGLLPYTELAVGIWFPQGGMFAVPKALERLGGELGVRYHYNTEVKSIRLEGGKATGVVLAGGEHVAADMVLCNADLPWAYRNLLPEGHAPKKVAKMKYTSSALMLYLGVDTLLPGLQHHNVMFGRDYRGSFEDIFQRGKVPDDPSFYVNVPSQTDPSLAPKGKSAVYVLVPVPNQAAKLDWSVESQRVREKVFTRLAELGHGEIERKVVEERIFTPNDFAAEWNLEHGAAFGLSHHFLQVGPFRPTNQDPKVKNLFFVGASTQPGTGVPMVMLSARLVTERISQFATQAGLARTAVPVRRDLEVAA